MATVLIEIDADDRKLKTALGNLEGEARSEGEEAGRGYGSGFADSVKNIALGNIIADQLLNAAEAVKEFAKNSVQEFQEFEKAIIGLGKTTGVSGQSLDKLGSSIKDLSEQIPVASNELLGIGQTAGQLGVSGSKNIKLFINTVAKLGSATNLTGQEAATALTRILNVSGESIDSIDQLGSVLVRLGNNFAASESEIVRVTTEVSRAASQFNITSAESAALGTALKSLGARAESAGSAVGRTLQALDKSLREGGKSLEALEDITGRTGEEFRRLFEQDTAKALQVFLKGVGEAESAAAELDKIGLSGQEILKVLPPLANNSEIFADALRQANEETRNATALNQEAATAFDSFGSDLTKLNNATTNLQTGIVEKLSPALRIASQRALEFIQSVDPSQAIMKLVNFGTAITTFVVAPLELLINIFSTVISASNAVAARVVEAFGIMGGKIADVISIFDDDNVVVSKLKRFQASSAEVAKDVQKDFNDAFNGILDFETSTALQERINSLKPQPQQTQFVNQQGTGIQDQAQQQMQSAQPAQDESGGRDFSGIKRIRKLSNELGPLTDNAGNKTDELASKAEKNAKRVNQAMNSALAQGISKGIQSLTMSLANGTFTFERFGKTVLGIVADMAIQIGQAAIATGVAMEAIGNLSGTKAAIAGAGLIAIGTLIKSFVGGGDSGAGAPSGGGGVPQTSTGGFEETSTTRQFEEEERRAEQKVALTVNGDILETEETKGRLVDLINEAFESDDRSLVGANFA